MTGLCRVVLAAALFLFTAHAQAREVSAEDRATARSLMDDGDAKTAAGDLAGALEAYRGADAIMGVPTTALEVAKAQAKLGQLVEAADTLNRVRRFPTAPDEPAAFAEARAAAETLVSEVKARTPSSRVTVKGAPEGSELTISVDDTPLRKEAMALPRKVNPGEHVVSVRAGELGAREVVNVKEGETRE